MGQAGYLHLFETGCRWLPGGPWLRSQRQVFRLTREKIHLPAEVRTSRQFSGKVEYVTTFAEPKIEPNIPVCIHLERGSPLFPQRRPVPYILSSPVSGSKPQPGEQVDQRHLPELFYLHPASIQIKSESGTALQLATVQAAAPQEAFPHGGSQGNPVTEVNFHFQGQGTAIDKGIPVLQPGPVIQCPFRPVQRFVSGQCGHSRVKEEGFPCIG